MSKGLPGFVKRFRFRWKYAFSTFFVCGVLSLSLGGKPIKPDYILKDAASIKAEYAALFMINKGKNATAAEMAGPTERTFDLDSLPLLKFTDNLALFGRNLSKESFKRGVNQKNTAESQAMLNVANAARIYRDLQLGLYRNYVRNLHDRDFKTLKTTSVVQSFLEHKVLGKFIDADEREFQRWLSLNKDAIKASGARGISPDAYDFLNIRLHPTVGQIFFGDKEAAFNIRHVRDAEGNFDEIELFINSFQKQMAEYEALAKPRTKDGYLKLLQFAGIREVLTNRWAIRRMNGRRTYDAPTQLSISAGPGAPVAFFDAKINSCAKDLLSFRMDKTGTINDLEAYSSLWQEDRVGDLTARGLAVAINSTTNVPLLTDFEYAELFQMYVKKYPAYLQIATSFQGDAAGMMASFRDTYSPYLKQTEEDKWSKDSVPSRADVDREGNSRPGFLVAKETFHLSNFPADDLSLKAVAERYADAAFRQRSYFLAGAVSDAASNRLTEVEEVETQLPSDSANPYASNPYATGGTQPPVTKRKTVALFPEAKAAGEQLRALKIVQEYLAARATSWKAAQAKRILAALQTTLGLDVTTANGKSAGVGYVRTEDDSRLSVYAQDVLPHAEYGTRGLYVRHEAERIEKDLTGQRDKGHRYCPPTPGAKCIITKYPDPTKIAPKDILRPEWYTFFAPFRNAARKHGIKDFILPETGDQLSQFFKKKLNAVMSYPNSDTKFEEPKIAEKIAKNAIVMRGVDMLFAEISRATKDSGAKSSRDGADSASNDVLTTIGAKAGQKGRKTASDPAKVGPNPVSQKDFNTRHQALSAAIIPAAKTAYENFLEGLRTEGRYKDPERAAKANAEARIAIQNSLSDYAKRQQSLTPSERAARADRAPIPISPALAKARETPAMRLAREAEEKAKVLEKKRTGYFHEGEDRTYEKEGGELFLTGDQDRFEAKQLYLEVLGMLGIAYEVAGATHPLRTTERYLPNQAVSWVTTEKLIRQQVGNVPLLERMVASVTDQYAMGKVLAEEAIAKAPILTLQDTWDFKQSEKKKPILLETLLRIYQPDTGFGDKTRFFAHFRKTLDTAQRNDRGKVETFCRADVKKYRDNEDFRKMFVATTGIRDILGTDSEIKKWDGAILKDSRSWKQSFMEDYIDPNTTPLMIAMVVVIIFQVVFTAGAGSAAIPAQLAAVAAATNGSAAVGTAVAAVAGGAAGAVGSTVAATTVAGALTTVAAQSVGRKILVFLGNLAFFQATGNYGIFTLIFSFQSYLMISTYHYKVPPQMGFTFQIANSRVQTMQLDKFAKGNMVDRDKMSQAIEELSGQQLMANISLVGELAQIHFFTIPGTKKTLGIIGQKYWLRLTKHSSAETVAKTGNVSLSQAISEEKSVSKGLAKYWASVKVPLLKMQRIKAVAGTDDAAEALRVAFGDSLAHAIPEKATLLEVYNGVLAEKKETLRFAQKRLMDDLFDSIAVKSNGVPTREAIDKVDELGRLRDKLKLSLETEEGEAFGSVIISKEYEQNLKVLSSVENILKANDLNGTTYSESKKIIASMAQAAQRETALKQVQVLERLIKNLEASVPLPGQTGTAAHFRRMSESASDCELHLDILSPKKFWMRSKSKYLSRDLGTEVKRYAKDYDYLKEDWTQANAWTRAIGQAVRTNQGDIFIDGKGEIGKLDSRDFEEHPEKYSVHTLSSEQLGLQKQKQKRTVDRMRKAAPKGKTN